MPICSTDVAITGRKCFDCRCISVICLAILKTEYDDEGAVAHAFSYCSIICLIFRGNSALSSKTMCNSPIFINVTSSQKQLLAPLDADMASFVHAEMRRHGVALRLGETVTGFRQDGDSVLTLLEGSEPLHSDMVLLAIGVTPDTHLAKEAGLRLGIRGSIAVNERMETSVPDIYAVGDAVEVTHFVTGQKALISLAGPANKQGRIAADNICGGNSHFTGSQGSSVLKLFGLTAASPADSLEHTIRYKKNLPINTEIETELKECADSSREWDGKMEHLLHIIT